MIFNFKQFINESFQDDLTDSSNFRSWFIVKIYHSFVGATYVFLYLCNARLTLLVASQRALYCHFNCTIGIFPGDILDYGS